MAGEEQIVKHFHYSDRDGAPTINMSFEKNSKGYNWSATVQGCETVEEAIHLLSDADEALKKRFAETV